MIAESEGGGPKTAQGKAVVRWNATRHGISSPMPTERWSASGLNARYAKTGSGIVPRLSTSTAPRHEG
jgi:hypothetical protein